MSTQNFVSPIDRQTPIIVSWKGSWKHVTVQLEREVVLRFNDKNHLKEGAEVRLRNGQVVFVQLCSNWSSVDHLIVEVNGQPALGSEADPDMAMRGAASVLGVFAVINVLLGAIALLGNVDLLLAMGFNLISIFMGIIYGVLAYFAKERSRVAIGVGLFIYVADFVGGALLTGEVASSGIVMRLVFVYLLVKGLQRAIEYHRD